MNDDTQTYKEYREEVKQEQSGLSRDEVSKLMQKRSEYQVDLDGLRPQEHQWVDRGQVMSCEGAAHPSHRAFKRR